MNGNEGENLSHTTSDLAVLLPMPNTGFSRRKANDNDARHSISPWRHARRGLAKIKFKHALRTKISKMMWKLRTWNVTLMTSNIDLTKGPMETTIVKA